MVIAVKHTVPSFHAWRENVSQQETLQAEVDSIRDQITQTKRNIDRFKTSPYFVERLARMNHRVADNEIVFIFQ
jgi:cell division protein FtsB